LSTFWHARGIHHVLPGTVMRSLLVSVVAFNACGHTVHTTSRTASLVRNISNGAPACSRTLTRCMWRTCASNLQCQWHISLLACKRVCIACFHLTSLRNGAC
jgi:hypothetical protein